MTTDRPKLALRIPHTVLPNVAILQSSVMLTKPVLTKTGITPFVLRHTSVLQPSTQKRVCFAHLDSKTAIAKLKPCFSVVIGKRGTY